jgi:MFS family permease
VGGRLADRRGRRPIAAAGLALLAGSLVPVAIAGHGVSPVLLAGSLAAAGAGLGLANAALGVAAVESLAARDAGVAAGIYSTGRYLGSIGSAALVAGLLGAGTDHAGTLFALSALAAMASAVVALALPGRPVARPAVRPVTVPSARAA